MVKKCFFSINDTLFGKMFILGTFTNLELHGVCPVRHISEFDLKKYKVINLQCFKSLNL